MGNVNNGVPPVLYVEFLLQCYGTSVASVARMQYRNYLPKHSNVGLNANDSRIRHEHSPNSLDRYSKPPAKLGTYPASTVSQTC